MADAMSLGKPSLVRTGPGASADERLAFERLLVDISSKFVNLAADELDAVTQTSLLRVREFLGFDRVSFGELVENGLMDILYSSAVEGIDPVPSGSLSLDFVWYLRKLRGGEMIVLQTLPDDLPPEAIAEAEYCRSAGFRAHVNIPIRVGGRFSGFLAFGSFRESRQWPVDLIARAKLIGEIIAQAFERKRSDEKLAAALAEVRSLKDRLEQENAYLRNVVHEKLPQGLASRSPRFQEVVEEAGQVAQTNATVLLLGETGSGKEVLAQVIHDASARKDRPMVKVNCAALPATLIESELFGREKGAFTGAIARQAGRFEIADGSTIFLDEIGELPLELQPKLLRVLQEGEFERLGGSRTIKVDVRVIAATNQDLAQAVREGRFREDLFYRLDVFPIELPPLRERREDIPLLSWTFVKEFSNSMGKQIEKISPDSMSALTAYSWPGNIRELRNVVERAMILAHGPVLHVKLAHKPLQLDPAKATDGTLDQAERAHIVRALDRCGWRIRGIGGAAEQLGIKPTTLESRMKKLGIVQAR
ncbi:sigma 54-interacting transcriptional regulator [Bradyrhizobium manausense]|uniref:sigma-54-dependent Fis family transcriptional regulator n=1 Tax=Bradyrhizobium manausense TaxID=989370 RepID=UPI001BA6C2BA|nr:sigma 54-interacting transcriptional regulator [Bradyrhizobium manausense]MBR1086288.1 sigma 54-interacting transcriptional regulator [Bradyrhizobium manausense]